MVIIEGRRLFEMFPSKGGDYLREEINRGTAIIRGNTVCLRYDSNSLLLKATVMLKLLSLKHFSLP